MIVVWYLSFVEGCVLCVVVYCHVSPVVRDVLVYCHC